MNEHLIHNEHEEQNDVIIYRSKDGKIIVSLMNCDGNVWLNQAQIATLFATSKQNVGQHISNILKENELDANSVVPQIRNPTKVSERCGPNRQECDFSSLD